MKFFGSQKEALEHAEGHSCFIGQEVKSNTHGNTYLRGSIKTWSDFKNEILKDLPRDKWTFNEWLRPDTAMKLFLDIDLPLEDWKKAENDPKRPEWHDPLLDSTKKAFIGLWQPRFQRVLQLHFVQGGVVNENNFYWSHACREDKLSFHVTVNHDNFVASDHHGARAYLDKIVEMYPEFAIYADPSVYRSNGFLRMVFNRKVLYNNALIPMFEYADEAEAFEKMNVQHFGGPTKEAFQFYNIPKTQRFLKKKKEGVAVEARLNTTIEGAVTAVIEQICNTKEVIKEIKVIEDLIVVGLTLKFCPKADREHSSNHQYAIINQQGLAFKCHSSQCAEFEYNKKPLSLLPRIIRSRLENKSTSTTLTTRTSNLDNSFFRQLNNTFNNGEMVQWTQAPTEVYRHQNDAICWVQPNSPDCLLDTDAAHMNPGVCGVVTNTEKCSVCVRCPLHGTVSRPDLKPILEHVHLGLIHVKGEITKKKDTELAALILDMFQIAETAHLRIGLDEGMMYGPVEGKPCVFQPILKFKDWVRENLMDDPRLLADPLRIDKLEKSLENACYSGVPVLKRNLDIIGFQNGVLKLSNNEFFPFATWDVDNGIDGSVCRHYINEVLDLTNLNTSAFDMIFEYQFSGMTNDQDKEYNLEELKDWIFALLGRLFFVVGERDDFEITPVIYGVAGSGKSSVGEMIQAFFPKNRIGSIGATFEAKFGLESLLGNDAIISLETPQNIHELLDKTNFQSMTTGETISAARKNKLALVNDWKIPLIFFSNQMLSFFDAGGASVARRIASIRFERALDFNDQDLTLKRKLKKTELPAALYKSVEAYNRLIANRSDLSRGFWSICPRYFVDQLNANLETTNPFLAWLKAPQDENGIIKDKHAFTVWDDMKQHIEFECPMNSKPRKMSTKTAEFSMMGWRADRKMICGCRKLGKFSAATCEECETPFVKKVVMFGCKLQDHVD